jgi:gamma-glutamyltranspeptidase/peptidoglycan/xylan/chitin deacetylase (PgdA/CDA1 family)
MTEAAVTGGGAVAAPRLEAIEAGERVLAAGGNAVDAAIAASFALGVAEPYMTGLGAVGEMVVCEPDGAVHVVDCAARAPLSARPDMFAVAGGPAGLYAWPQVEGDANVRGPRAAAAPALVAGLAEAHGRFGALPWAAALAPAVELARDGVDVDFFTAAVLAHEMATLSRDELAAELYYAGGVPAPPPVEGNPVQVRNGRLASALEEVAAAGAAALGPDGPLAGAILAAAGADGHLTPEDLAPRDDRIASWVEPLVTFRGWRVFGSLRPSGGVTCAQILGLLDQLDEDAAGPEDPRRHLRIALASERAFADRLAGLSGDAVDVAAALLEPSALRAAAGALAPRATVAASRTAARRTPTATTHVSVADASGMVVSLTQTLLSLFGAQVGVRERVLPQQRDDVVRPPARAGRVDRPRRTRAVGRQPAGRREPRRAPAPRRRRARRAADHDGGRPGGGRRRGLRAVAGGGGRRPARARGLDRPGRGGPPARGRRRGRAARGRDGRGAHALRADVAELRAHVRRGGRPGHRRGASRRGHESTIDLEAGTVSDVTNERDVSIALTFDFDAYSTWIGTFGATSPSMLSRGEFGPVGVRRLLDLLARYQAPGTFFTPGHTALAFPGTVQAIQHGGHEIGHHGWVHENPAALAPAEERRVLERGLEALERIADVRPVGYRSPAWDNSPHTVELLLEHGFEYESSMMGNDFEPYWCRVGDEWSTTEEYRFGTPVPLVELPVAWHLDDWPQFEYVVTPQMSMQGVRSPAGLLDIWKGEFDYLYERIGHGVLTLTMHPQVIGRGHRLLFLETFLDYVAGRPGVRFTTCTDYVRRWREGRQPSLPADAGPARAAGPVDDSDEGGRA